MKLFLLMCLPSGLYGLDAQLIEEVVPCLEYTPLPNWSGPSAGMVECRSYRVPILDLGWLLQQAPSPSVFGTRMVLLRKTPNQRSAPLVALLAPNLIETVYTPSSLCLMPSLPGHYLHPVCQTEEGPMQVVDVPKLLKEQIDPVYDALQQAFLNVRGIDQSIVSH